MRVTEVDYLSELHADAFSDVSDSEECEIDTAL
jgi:hypothetical protein